MKLEEIRKELDVVDKEMRSLFERRMELAKNVADVKFETGDEIYKPDREKEVISKNSEPVSEEFRKEYQLFQKDVIGFSRSHQYRVYAMKDRTVCINKEDVPFDITDTDEAASRHIVDINFELKNVITDLPVFYKAIVSSEIKVSDHSVSGSRVYFRLELDALDDRHIAFLYMIIKETQNLEIKEV